MESPDRNVSFLLHDVARLMRKRFEQNARSLKLTRSQYQVLAHLSRNDGIQQGSLAELIEVEPITLTRILDRLEEAGLVEPAPIRRTAGSGRSTSPTRRTPFWKRSSPSPR